jgi:DNA polymerase III epsilon subunit-like protein
MNENQNYLALDLELNNARDGSTPNPKIIQVGVAWGSYRDYTAKSIQTRKWYIDPGEPIYPEITALTGISDRDIATNSVPHQVVADGISAILVENNCFVNPITWGGGDSMELLGEFRDRDIQFRHFGRRWIDTKTWFIYNRLSLGNSTGGGLGSSMPKFGIHFEGTAHRADVDAYNTLRLFFVMLARQKKLEDLLEAAQRIK